MGAKGIGINFSLNGEKFFANAKKAESAVGSLKKKLTGATSAMKTHESGLNSLAKKAVGVVAAYAGTRQIVNFGKDCIESANAQIKAEERLDQLMMNVKGTTKEAVESVKAYSSELQGITTVGDEVSMVGASQLATFQMQSDSIKKLMPAMNDLAVATYGVNVSQDQMQQTANLVGKVMNGNVGALTRVGVTFNATQEKILKTGTESEKAAALVDVLGVNFGGLAERMAKTPEGRIVQLKNAWGDVKEEIGSRLYPVITDLFGWIAERIPSIQERITGAIDKVSPYAQTAVDMIKNGMERAGNAVAWVKDNWGWLEPIIIGVVTAIAAYKAAIIGCNAIEKISLSISKAKKALMLSEGPVMAAYTAAHWALSAGYGPLTAAQWALNAAFKANPLGLVVTVIAAAIAIGVALYKNWDKIKELAGKLWESIKAAFGAIKDKISGAWNSVKEKTVNAWNSVKEKTSNTWNGVKEKVGGVLDSVKEYAGSKLSAVKNTYEEHGGGIKGAAFAAMEGVKQYYSIGYDALNTMTGGKLDVLKNVAMEKFNSLKDRVKETFTNIKDFISSIWDSIKNGAKGMVNGIISVVNSLIGGVNKIHFTLPDALGGATVGFNIPTIPMLANGGMIRRSGSVIVGERGPELLNLNRGASVVPLPKNGGATNQNTFYITITPRSGDEDGINELVRRVRLALDTM